MTKDKTKSRKTILVHASKDSSHVMYPKNSTHKYFSDIFNLPMLLANLYASPFWHNEVSDNWNAGNGNSEMIAKNVGAPTPNRCQPLLANQIARKLVQTKRRKIHEHQDISRGR